MKIVISLLVLLILTINSCIEERNNSVHKTDEEINYDIEYFDHQKNKTNCGKNNWQNFPMIIGVQYDKIILSQVNVSKKVSYQKIPWGKPDSITYYDEEIYDNMSDYQNWHYGKSTIIFYKNKIEDFYICDNNFVLNQPIYAEIGKTKCNDFRDYLNCDCDNILDTNGNGKIIINIIATEMLIVTDAYLFFDFEDYYLKSFGLKSQIF